MLAIAVSGTAAAQRPAWQVTPSHWNVSTPEAQGMDPAILEEAFREAASWDYILSLLIVKNGYLVGERYYNGCRADALVPVYSAAKSVTSALVGIAISEGFIDGIDQPIRDFFPEAPSFAQNPEKGRITIRHLLTMQAGIEEESRISNAMKRSPDMTAAILAAPLRFTPGSGFLYSTHGSHLLSVIIARATGKNTVYYAREKLFRPLGIQSLRWVSDQNGYTFGGAGLSLTARDMARFGYLYLKKGSYDGRQIVPAAWVDQSVKNHRDYTEPWREMREVGYGFHWWTGRFDEHRMFFASGFGGQWIVVVPDLDLVIVAAMNAAMERNWENMSSFIPVMYRLILPAAGG